MGNDSNALTGPDLRQGVSLADIPSDRPFGGHDGSEAVVLVRQGDEVYAIGGTCTHYSGPLADGIVTDGCIRCPWHHAQFSVRTGEPMSPPALNPLPRWRTTIRDGRVFLQEKLQESPPRHAAREHPRNVVIIGAGAAGAVAAETLRTFDYDGDVILIDPDHDAPYDRPNLSKDYLAGNAPDEWMRLRDAEFYREKRVDRVHAAVASIDTWARVVTLSNMKQVSYDALLIATGCAPVRPPIPGVDQRHVHVLRSWTDARNLIAALEDQTKVVLAGASFVGLEAAAALRSRNLDVSVVAPETVPFARVLGGELGALLRSRHEHNGVQFHLGHTISRINERDVELDDGSRLSADVVLLAVGVKPLTQLAESAGLEVDNGVVVDAHLRTSVPGIYAAGDIARYRDVRSNDLWRIEHWVVAEQQGRTAARNILGMDEPFAHVPFFWTHQYDLTINYSGHATKWDEIRIDGTLEPPDCRIAYMLGGREVAVATINRDMECLLAEVAQERSL